MANSLYREGGLHLLIYFSAVGDDFTEDDLIDILQASHRNNPRSRITGCLLFGDRRFMQVLEGPRDEVQRLMRDKIARDMRHRRIFKAVDTAIDSRLFPDWSMHAIRDVSKNSFDMLKFQVESLNRLDGKSDAQLAALTLLGSFIDGLRLSANQA